LRALFGHPDCNIQHLELEEMEVEPAHSWQMIDAIRCLPLLYTFDFSNNSLPWEMSKSIKEMLKKYHMVEILCLDHC